MILFSIALKEETAVNLTRLERSERDLIDSKSQLEQNLISLRTQFELSQQEKLEFQARYELYNNPKMFFFVFTRYRN